MVNCELPTQRNAFYKYPGIKPIYINCQAKKQGKKGFPKFKKKAVKTEEKQIKNWQESI